MIVNWDLLKHPLNWAIVILMLVIAGAAGHYALAYFGARPAAPMLPSAEESMAGPNRKDIAAAVL